MAMLPPRLDFGGAIIVEVEHQVNDGRASLLEELAARAWPALESERVDGWLLRCTPLIARRRLNSALPQGDGGGSVEVVERFYRERGLTPRVQVGPAEQLGALDAALEGRGWTADGATDILVARGLELSDGDVDVAVAARVDRAWLEAWVAAEGRPDAEETYARVLRHLPAPAGFAIARVDGRPAGVGIAVCERGWAAIFCMATHPALRRRGVARAVLGALAAWSRGHGADGLHLQVEVDNAPARALYASLGFTRSHGYHFRTAR
jgi:ribosomal protein S18 acetylase RimI-like enzyme